MKITVIDVIRADISRIFLFIQHIFLSIPSIRCVICGKYFNSFNIGFKRISTGESVPVCEDCWKKKTHI